MKRCQARQRRRLPATSGRSCSAALSDFFCASARSGGARSGVVAKAEHLPKGTNPRFVVTSLAVAQVDARTLYEDIYCTRGQVENRIKEQQLDLFADRTPAATLRANQLRLWFASFAYVLLEALRRIGLRHTQFATATSGTIRLKLLKIGAQVWISVRRIKVAMASACPYQADYHLAYLYLQRAAGFAGRCARRSTDRSRAPTLLLERDCGTRPAAAEPHHRVTWHLFSSFAARQ
jgi:Transposase DDE domain group 1